MAKLGVVILSVGGWLASFIQWRGYASEAGGIMWLANTLAILTAILAWATNRFGGNPSKIERVAAYSVPGYCVCPGGGPIKRGMMIGRCRNCQGWREVKSNG